jgi:hypothetical protein
MTGRCLISEEFDDRFERLRLQYRPAQVSLLFVGESHPAGETFFYAGNSHLFRYTAEAFGYRTGKGTSAEDFLTHFMDLGCYLVDLCGLPLNHLPARAREAERDAWVEVLADTVQVLQPKAVLSVMKGIRPHVERAVLSTDVQLSGMWHLPFPAQGHQRAYVVELRRVLTQSRLMH